MDRFVSRLERRFGKYAPANVIWWIVGGSGLVYALLYLKPELAAAFTLDADAVLHGEVWRLITFLFLPWGGGTGVLGPIFTLFALMFLYTVGSSLEEKWGPFRFDFYYLIGVAGTLAASLITKRSITNQYINLSLLLAFATEFPDFEILLFLILPVKMKWLGVLSAAGLVWTLLTGPLPAKAGVLVAMLNYLLFFAGPLVDRARGRARSLSRPGRADAGPASAFRPAAHRNRVCALCGKSEADDPRLEFRVCDCAEKCHGKATEYCLAHARAH